MGIFYCYFLKSVIAFFAFCRTKLLFQSEEILTSDISKKCLPLCTFYEIKFIFRLTLSSNLWTSLKQKTSMKINNLRKFICPPLLKSLLLASNSKIFFIHLLWIINRRLDLHSLIFLFWLSFEFVFVLDSQFNYSIMIRYLFIYAYISYYSLNMNPKLISEWFSINKRYFDNHLLSFVQQHSTLHRLLFISNPF